jgi:hypothetical protein
MNAVDQFGMDTVGAVSTLVTANQYMQALVLLYSAIDTLAWVSRSAGDVTRADFCRWVDVYMQPQSRLGCTAEDLYGARCSILHSSAAESKLSREGRVNELWYVTSPHAVTRLEAYVQKVGAQAKVVYFSSLVAAFADGIMQFSDDLAADPSQHAQCSERLKRWLRFLPTGALEGYGEGQ